MPGCRNKSQLYLRVPSALSAASVPGGAYATSGLSFVSILVASRFAEKPVCKKCSWRLVVEVVSTNKIIVTRLGLTSLESPREKEGVCEVSCWEMEAPSRIPCRLVLEASE